MNKPSAHKGRSFEVFKAFLILGLTSFGGPIAHLGYFRTEFVERRKWLSEQDYASLVTLCQFLPGPASSQVGLALGLFRGGPIGAAAAWLAFTLPSALLLILFALGANILEGPITDGIIHGLKIVAVAIVAHAVWGMAQNLCPDKTRTAIALTAILLLTLFQGPLGQVGAIVLGGLAGWMFCKPDQISSQDTLNISISKTVSKITILLFIILLIGLPLLTLIAPTPLLEFLDAYYRSGALVFGGGHVVLPLLEAEVVQSGWVSPDQFLAGYGAAQAVPGPLFTFAAYLGAVMEPAPGGLFGAGIALCMIFLPGFLLLIGSLPYWNTFKQHQNAQAMMRGANAAVVGILGAALYDPIWTSAVVGPLEFFLALSGFLMLQVWKMPALIVVASLAICGILIT